MPRSFRLKIREGRGFGSFTSAPDEVPTSARAEEEVVVPEHVAAVLIRDRIADVIEVIESEGIDPTAD